LSKQQQQQQQKKQLKCLTGIKLIVIFTILLSLIELAEGIDHIVNQEEGFQYFIQGTWLMGVGFTEIIIGIFTLRGKGWAWKSNVVTQLAAVMLLTISLTVYLSDPSSVSEDALVIASPPLVVVQIIIGLIALSYLFTRKVRSYFGKSDFSFKHLMDMDERRAWDHLHHLWIASLFAAILFSIMGSLLLLMRGQHFYAILIASLLFISAVVILGQAYDACKRKNRRSSILLLAVFLITTGLLAYFSIDVYASKGGFWALSAEILGIPLFQGVRCIFVITKAASLG